MSALDPIPDFDCVESKGLAQAEIRAEIGDLSPAEEIRYFEEQALRGPLGDLWRRLIANKGSIRDRLPEE